MTAHHGRCPGKCDLCGEPVEGQTFCDECEETELKDIREQLGEILDG